MPGYSTISRTQSFGHQGSSKGRSPSKIDIAYETALLEHMPLLGFPRDFDNEDSESLHSEPDNSALWNEVASPRDLSALLCVVLGIPAAHLTFACIPVALGWISAADVVRYFALMLVAGLTLDVAFCVLLLVQLLRGFNLRDAMPAALKVSVQAMCFFVLLCIFAFEAWLLAQGGIRAGVAF